MRAAMFSLIWLGCIALAEAQTAAPTPTASLSPKTVVEAVADPSKAESQNFDIEYLSRSFAFSIDRLSVQLSQTLGPWSKYNLFLQITPAKIILGILSALVALAILQVVRLLLAAVHRRRHNEPSERFWVGGILRALRKGVGIFFWVTAIFLFLSPLLPHIAIVNCVTFIQMIRAVEDMLVSRTSLRNHDTYKFRGFLTRLQVLRRLIVFLVIMISIGVILMNIDAVRQVGTGLLASAGVAGVIFGFAAQKSLSTIIAGFQIALTGPMKIDDVVIVEGEYGTIEEITLTYAVVKLWDR